jgi:hypothetical protein
LFATLANWNRRQNCVAINALKVEICFVAQYSCGVEPAIFSLAVLGAVAIFVRSKIPMGSLFDWHLISAKHVLIRVPNALKLTEPINWTARLKAW